MIVFGTCVGGAGERYESITLPSIRRVAARDDVVLRRPGDPGIAAVYNSFIEEARALPDAQALVLLHDDVEIIDPWFRAKVLRHVAAADAGVVGVVGGAGLQGLEWWNARRTVGRVFETRRAMDFGSRRGSVDVVDGLLMVISPEAFRRVRFDERTFPRFHGYDADYCLAVKEAGLAVRVAAIDLVHRTKTGYGSRDDFDLAEQALLTKWTQHVRRPHLGERIVRRAAQTPNLRHVVATAGRRVGRGRRPPTAKSELAVPSQADRREIARMRAEWLSLRLPTGTLLEWCSGTGDFLQATEDLGVDAEGVEPDTALGVAARAAGLDVCTGNLADWRHRSEGQRVDAIVSWSEPDLLLDRSALSVAVSLLAPHGMFVVELASGEAQAQEAAQSAMEAAGMRITEAITFSSENYVDGNVRLAHRNRALLERRSWPSFDRTRIVARSSSESPAEAHSP